MTVIAYEKGPVITIEFGDGRVLRGLASEYSIEATVPRRDLAMFNDDFAVVGLYEEPIISGSFIMAGAEVSMAEDVIASIEAFELSGIWECPYCGKVNVQDAVKCWDGTSGCQASRPIIYRR